MKTFVVLVSVETQEVMAQAELSPTRLKSIIKSYEKAGCPVVVKEAA